MGQMKPVAQEKILLIIGDAADVRFDNGATALIGANRTSGGRLMRMERGGS
ncbi:MAG: hypothetical protein HY332_06640 [Chloroflexi bacterium]|nr:hypothetical protein [Chloroflexota bacterium]